MAHDFYTKYPEDKRAGQAKFFEMRALNNAEQMGSTNALARLQQLEKSKLADPNASEDERLQARFNEVQRKAEAKGEFGTPGFTDEMLKGLEELHKRFPGNGPTFYSSLCRLRRLQNPTRPKKVLQEVIDGNAPAQLKEMAKGTIAQNGSRLANPSTLNSRPLTVAKLT